MFTLLLPTLITSRLPWRWSAGGVANSIVAAVSTFVFLGMGYLGLIVSHHIEEAAVHRSAAAAVLYLDSLIEPRLQELARSTELSAENLSLLDEVLQPTTMNRPLVAFRVWRGEKLVFGSDRRLIGDTFQQTAERTEAQDGHVVTVLGRPDGDDDARLRALNVPLMEIYAPVRESGTGRVIAVVETYELAVDLQRQIWMSQFACWLLVGALTLGILLQLFSLARSGELERRLLALRLTDATVRQQQSEQLQQRTSASSRRVSELQERYLRRVADELYAGPVQNIGLALLKLDSVGELVSQAESSRRAGAEELESIRVALNETLKEIRGLSANMLPIGIERLALADLLALVAWRFEQRNKIAVDCSFSALPDTVDVAVKACLYRLLIDSLTLVSDLAPGNSLMLRAKSESDWLNLEIAGFSRSAVDEAESSQGFVARCDELNDRLHVLGGQLSLVEVTPGVWGLSARLQLKQVDQASE